MSFIKKVSKFLHARGMAYLFFIFSVCSFIFLHSATWAYSWIAALYPLGDKFVPTLLGIISICIGVPFFIFSFLLLQGIKEIKSKEKQ